MEVSLSSIYWGHMKKVALWGSLVSLFTIPFLVLYIDNSLFFPFITGKNFAFRILVEIAFVSWIVLALSDKTYRPKFSWPLVFFGLFVIWMAVANTFAINPEKAFWSNFERMEGFVTLVHVFLFFIVSGSVLSAQKLWRKWWLTFIGASGLICIYGIMQIAGIAAIHQGSTRLTASLGNAEYLAGYLLFALAVTIWQAFLTKGRDWQWLRISLFALALLQLIILFGTGTRGTFIALVGAVGFGALMWMFESGKRGKQGAAVVLAGLLLIVGSLYVAKDTSFVKNSESLNRIATIFNPDSFTIRFTLADMALKGIKERPVTGWGQEGFNYIFYKHYEPKMYAQEPWFDRAHNIYLDWTVAGGIPALLLFLGLLLSSMWALYRANSSRAERVLLTGAVVGYAIQGLAVFDNLFTYIPLAAIFAIAHNAHPKEIESINNAPEISEARLATVVGPLAIVILSVILWVSNAPHVSAGKSLIQGLTPNESPIVRLEHFKQALQEDSFASQEIREQLIQFAVGSVQDVSISQSDKQAIATFMINEMDKQVLEVPGDARLHMQFAMAYRVLGFYEEAKKQSALAREVSPRKQGIIIEQGLEALQAKEYTVAQAFFQEAYQLDTANDEAASFLAATDILQGRKVEGEMFLKKHFGTTTVNHQALLLAYYQTKDWKTLLALLRLREVDIGDANSGFQVAAGYAESGDIVAARAKVREVMNRYPESTAQGAAILTQLGS